MKKELHPEWILSLPEPAIDGVIVEDHIFVLTTKKVYQYEVSSRLLHGSFTVAFGELNSISMQKVHYFDKTGLLITKRCGNIQIYNLHGGIVSNTKLIADPGFCSSVIIDDELFGVISDHTKPEIIEIFELPSLEYKKSITLMDKKHLGPPMSFTTSSDGKLSCGFESGEILSWKSDGTFLNKEIYSNNPLLHVRKFCLGDRDGTITFDSNGEVKRYLNMDFKTIQLDPSATVLEVRNDGKLSVLGNSSGSLRLMSTKSLKTLSVLYAHSKQVNNIRWEKLHFYSFGDDSKVCCYKPYDH